MQNSRYVLIGFAVVLITGGLVTYCAVTPQKTEQTEQTSVSNIAQVEANKPDTSKINQPETDASSKVTDVNQGNSQPDQSAGTETTNAEAVQALTVPVFDILRLESDGSLVVAGKAAPNSMVDVISKTRVLGSSKAGESGDFAIVLDQALKAGDYQLVLRATAEGNVVATSRQTAILSVPETSDGQVLALVEEAGQASRLITTPQAGALEATTQPAVIAPDNSQGISAPTSVPATGSAVSPVVDEKAKLSVAVEAVEIDGQTIFVAGSAHGGHSVQISANEILLGRAQVTPAGRFLVQTQQPLPVGDYIIRADLLDQAGKVLTTARVPFRREAGENISAVAPKAVEALVQPNSQSADVVADDGKQPLEKAEGSVIIRKGDNLWTISKRTYGDGMRYTTIYLANSDQIKNPDLIWPGQIFVMPHTPLSDEEVKQKQPR